MPGPLRTQAPRACEVFGLELGRLMALTREPAASAHRLPNGLNLWLLARFHSSGDEREVFALGAPGSKAGDAPASAMPAEVAAGSVAPPQPADSTLRESDRHLIGQTLQSFSGNVLKAAPLLGVSRGLVYRHPQVRSAESLEGRVPARSELEGRTALCTPQLGAALCRHACPR